MRFCEVRRYDSGPAAHIEDVGCLFDVWAEVGAGCEGCSLSVEACDGLVVGFDVLVSHGGKVQSIYQPDVLENLVNNTTNTNLEKVWSSGVQVVILSIITLSKPLGVKLILYVVYGGLAL